MACKTIIVDTKTEIESNLKNILERVSKESIQKRKLFKIGISGGSALTFFTNAVISMKDDLSKWRIFFCDERVVPEDDADSTYGACKRGVIARSTLKENQFIKIKQGVNARDAATEYAQQMKLYFNEDSLPDFDLLLLGMGLDGHICSLFPEHPLLEEKSLWVAPIEDSPKPPPCRITLTLPVVNNARNCVFAVTGEEKADVAKKVLINKDESLPAARVNPISGNLYWILEKTVTKNFNYY